MNSKTALKALGVDDQTLTDAQKAQLDKEGYLSIPNVLSVQQCLLMRQRLDEIADEEGKQAGQDFHTETGTTRLGSLIHKDPMFDVCVSHPLVLASIAHIIQEDFGLSSITSRTALPGEGQQPFHCDFAPGVHHAANALWLLDPFTTENGPTRLVPGSHRRGQNPSEVMNPDHAHPDEIRVIAPGGTLVVINAFLWHSGTRNRTDQPRHLISAFFTAREHYQSIAMRTWTPELEARITPTLKYLLDYQQM